ncbi:hypothetical protein HRR83_009383 [Exophiala dermatitidis]|uniref:Retrograde regulation protein 2 n=2 Tax=Exophiala dermatitidis TaxID=5970 RepID=H6BLZ7_EXODN|nr:retrograde regulation protein 2 [Exophiala dermatitidis NIH/UT8656]KAJ4502898.1 hypothetical protein HRR73_009327 [Exophiala dermatitidis]EHY52933.1 retrograde regulation protein 2 [Exophiala dermatitidis NIH/UT8656]KAJ4512260.1 hypothetical protein HRR75_005160 [Exophiala dermatitidis]KAJ4515166.1 hypothetical protein HRR74_005631 [Exophiala dermatitidis]KAJ4536214.1 hypothetical protein HRR78_008562 [Exophiala dermatitidis]
MSPSESHAKPSSSRTPAPRAADLNSDGLVVVKTRHSHSRDADEDAVELRRLHHHHHHHHHKQHGRRGDNEADTAEDAECDLATTSDDSEVENGSKTDEEHGIAFKPMRRIGTESKEYTSEEEEAVVHKLDRKLVLFLGFLYMLSFLDRSNIGNARIAGLEQDLSLTSSQYDWLLTAFYMTYIAFEWMILLYRLVPPHVYISMCVLSWGLVASMQSLTTSFRELLALRAILGVTEAAFGPGVPFYMTFFYKRSELAYRVGLQIAAAPLATSFASSLAWVIVKLSQNGPIAPWRTLFLVEGFPSVLAAVAAWYYIPDSPAKARYLTPRERKVAVLRLREEQPSSSRSDGPSNQPNRVNFHQVLDTIRDPKSYLTALMFLSVNVSFSSLPVFLPTIINSMSFSPLASQALAAPPYLLAFLFVLLIGRYSDKIPDSRSLFLMGVALLSAFSYAGIALAGYLHESLGESGSITIRYVAVFGAAIGLFASVTLIITWTLNNQATATGKGTGLTILNIVGQCGPLIGVHVFPKSQGPFYIQGMTICAAFMALGVAGLAGILRLVLQRENRKNGFSASPRGGEYELVTSVGTGRKSEEQDTPDIGDLRETLMGGAKKAGWESGGFRYML